jgi:hypothetical protein
MTYTPQSCPRPPLTIGLLVAISNALRLLQYLRERERRREPELPETPAISEVIGLTLDDTNDLIDILEREWAIKETWTIDGVAHPVLTGQGKLINHTSIQVNLPMKVLS